MYEVKAYHCSYCKKYGMTKKAIEKHEDICFGNPVTRSCKTCAWGLSHGCELRPNLFDPLQTNCPKWETLLELVEE